MCSSSVRRHSILAGARLVEAGHRATKSVNAFCSPVASIAKELSAENKRKVDRIIRPKYSNEIFRER